VIIMENYPLKMLIGNLTRRTGLVRNPSCDSVCTQISKGSLISLNSLSYRKIQDSNNKSYDPGNDLIHCGAISKILGLQRSFSCSDILPVSDSELVRSIRSDSFLPDCEDLIFQTAEGSSGSVSDCMAGDNKIKSSSQLPSPDAELVKVLEEDESCYQFFHSDLISCLTKRPRQNYIRRRLKVIQNAVQHHQDVHSRSNASTSVSTKQISENRGKPLSKYERNIVIFNWLHTLDEGAVIGHDDEDQFNDY